MATFFKLLLLPVFLALMFTKAAAGSKIPGEEDRLPKPRPSESSPTVQLGQLNSMIALLGSSVSVSLHFDNWITLLALSLWLMALLAPGTVNFCTRSLVTFWHLPVSRECLAETLRTRELKSVDDNIKQLEKMIQEKSTCLASFQREIQSLQERGSLDSKELVGKAHARAGELEDQVDNLKKEIERQVKNKEALESRANNAKKEIQELNARLGNAMEKKAQIQKWVQPRVDTLKVKRIRIFKEHWFAFITICEPKVQLLAAKTVEVYNASKDIIRPLFLIVQMLAVPHVQEAKKFTKPLVAIPLVFLKPYTQNVFRVSKKSVKTATKYYRQVQANNHQMLNSHEFTKFLVHSQLVWFMSFALLVLAAFPLLGKFFAIFCELKIDRGEMKNKIEHAVYDINENGKDTNVGVSGVTDENVVVERGRDLLPPIGGKKSCSQSKSRDAISSLDGRTCVLEEAMGDAKDRLGFVEQNLQTLEDHVLEELESLKKAVMGEDELRTRFMELFANLQEQLDVEFTTLMLNIPNMTEEDLLFNFIDGLQNWAKQELQRRGVKDIDEAIAVAESLMEYARVGDSSKGKNVQVASKGNHAKGGGDKPKAWHKGNNQAGTNKFEGHGKLEERRAKSKLNALVEENEELKEGDVHMGSLQILNALHAKAVAKVPTGKGQASTGKGLLYMEAKLNGKPAQVMVDTGATHNFVTMEEAKRLGLKVVGGGGWLKSVNTNAKPLQGAARQVEMCLGSWRGLVDFSVAPMDDFKVVIGLDFLRQVNASVSPYSNAVHIMEKGVSCAVPTSVGTSSAKTLASMQLSAMQIMKGVKKGETTYLAALKMEDHVGDSTEPLPRAIEEVLERNKDHDPLARQLFKLAESGQTQRFWVEDGLLYTKGQRAYVPKWNNLRKRIIRECHDTPWAGHPGQRRTYALVEASYYWPQMKDEVEAYVKTCLVC
ncbi:hypothetical protein RJ640_001721 [Escallonia rubra]|uniref:Integrase zinc-binding domain-containing protein n=1 Tax=Escallonia rubra TaxID=112253 RepID=A0AA88U6J1_9ASTE|nr:hypothetical protein RJ640_001721 [Escallonia rubra]